MPPLPPLSEADRAVIAEEEDLLRRVQQRLQDLAGERRLRGDAGLRVQELRDEAASAHEEDLAAIFDQLHVVRAIEDRRRPAAALPEPRSPYFAHFRLRDSGGVRDYLLGHVPLLDSASGLRLLDWRNAPLSQIYYRYREGEAFEADLPGRKLEGHIDARRALVIVEGELRAITTPHGRFERVEGEWMRIDEAALPELGGGSGSAQRGLGLGMGRQGRLRMDVAALLDPVQFEIVNQSGDGPLLVLGSAGSGKTTVALHRLAALHYQAPDRFSQKKLSVIVPEPGLSRLIARLLAPLGLSDVEVLTFTQYATRELQRLSPDLPRDLRDDSPPGVARLKRHRALHARLPEWVVRQGKGRKIESLRRDLLTDRDFLSAVVARAGGELRLTVIDETIQRTLRQISQTSEASFRGVERSRLEALDGQLLDAGTPEDLAQTLDVEDLPLLLELWRLTRGDTRPRQRAHLVLDEAQELCSLELSSLRQALGGESVPSVTVAGDDVQRTGAGEFDGWDLALEDLEISSAMRRTLAVSYRCPLPIARLAHDVLGPLAQTALVGPGRPGSPIGLHRFPHAGSETLFLQDALSDLVAREPQASVAVLTRNASTAARWAQALSHLPQARLVRHGEFTFEPGIDVCEVAEAKGLEFDYVVLPDADAASYPEDDDSRRTLHVAITRAMYQLWLAHVGTPSPLLPVAFLRGFQPVSQPLSDGDRPRTLH